MSEEKFDELSRLFASSISRRQAVKIIGATAFGGALSLVGARGARAEHGGPGRCRQIGTVCRQHEECCEYYCDPFTGRCACPPSTFLCPGRRGNPRARCIYCPQGATFDPQTCTCQCPEGTQPCEGFYGLECCPEGEMCCPGGFCSVAGVCYYGA